MSEGAPALESRPVDLADPERQQDPYPFYAELRERAVNLLDMPSGFRLYWVGRYADVVSVLRDPRFRAEKEVGDTTGEGVPAAFRRLGELLSHMMLLKDAPDHTRLRGLVNKAFTPRVVEGLRPRVEAIIETLLDDALGAGRLEVIGDLATPLPVIVIAELMGIPLEDRDEFKRWSDAIAVVLDGSIRLDGLPAAAKAAEELSDYLRRVVARRRRRPGEDLLSRLVAARDDEDALSEEELLANAILILLAGHETTTNLIGNGVLALADHQDAWAALRRDPGLARGAVEEALRYDSPVQLTSRLTVEPVELAGAKIEPGVEVDVSLGSANRDPAQFPEPDRFRPQRAPNRHVSFGLGAHFCLGAPLARLEGEAAFAALARRLPVLEVDRAGVRRRPGNVLRGMAALPLRLSGSRAGP